MSLELSIFVTLRIHYIHYINLKLRTFYREEKNVDNYSSCSIIVDNLKEHNFNIRREIAFKISLATPAYYSISIHPWEPGVSPFQKRLQGNCSPLKETTANDSRISRIPGCIPEGGSKILSIPLCVSMSQRKHTTARQRFLLDRGITAAILSFPDLCRRFNLELLRARGLSFRIRFLLAAQSHIVGNWKVCRWQWNHLPHNRADTRRPTS